MLGEVLEDTDGVEGTLRRIKGMGLLPCSTVFAPEKIRTRVRAETTGGPLGARRWMDMRSTWG